jgi:hypothetical protein
MDNEDFQWSLENPVCNKAHQTVSKEFMELNRVQPEWLAIVQEGVSFQEQK